MVLDRAGHFMRNKVEGFVTDACATVAVTYHRLAGVYVADEKMERIRNCCRSPLNDSNLYIRAQRE